MPDQDPNGGGARDGDKRARERPWDRPYPEFAYSESKEARRRRCARAYYHAVYTAHRGWAAPAGSVPFLAYRLRKTTPLSAAVGGAIHAAATACVGSLLAGERLPTFAALRSGAAASLNALWRSSRDRRQEFWRRPNDVPMLEEAIYRCGPGPEALRRARQKLDRCLASLLDCHELWRMVTSACRDDVLVMDRFYHFYIADDLLPGGVKCYAAADLIVRPGPGAPWFVVDLKSGAPDGVVDQLLTYALAARDGLGLNLSAGCFGSVVALDAAPERRTMTFEITPDDVDGAAARIRSAVAAMRALLIDPIANAPSPADAFAPARDQRICASCTYRAVCYPDTYDLSWNRSVR